ncbi:MAG TPA: HlyD family efflux transporter periplasmic adaptor subunit [Bryobacteraceae bacterium]|nr:HlyD family efflux transporter periplasmic adaptor subunit [Bryobacteraceae bacterium]
MVAGLHLHNFANMDVPRQGVARRKLIRRILVAIVALLVIGGSVFAVSRLQPALPSVDAGTLWPDTVKRGSLLRQVHGLGSLVPEEVVWLSAQTDARIEKIYIQPGTPVHPDTIIMKLSNPTITEAMVGAEFDLKQAQASLTDLNVSLQSTTFDKQAAAAQVNADYQQAKIEADRDKQLSSLGLIPEIDLKQSQNKAQELEFRNGIEEKRLKIIQQSVEAQLAAQRVKIEQLQAVYALKKQQVEELSVRAGVNGVLQQLGNATATANGTVPPLEVGQNVTAGSILAKVAQQDKLKAQIKVTETEAKDVALGQAASIDTRNGVIPGRVSRIDPAAVNGTVLVDVTLQGELPAGARPDLSVDGTIDIEKLNDVLYVGRPTSAQPNSSVTLFRMDPGGKTATRVPVKLGRASVSSIEVVGGLKEGDSIILSDMSAQDGHDRIRLQ